MADSPSLHIETRPAGLFAVRLSTRPSGDYEGLYDTLDGARAAAQEDARGLPVVIDPECFMAPERTPAAATPRKHRITFTAPVTGHIDIDVIRGRPVREHVIEHLLGELPEALTVNVDEFDGVFIQKIEPLDG